MAQLTIFNNKATKTGGELSLRILFLIVFFLTGLISILSFLTAENGAISRNFSQISTDHIIIAAYFIIAMAISFFLSSWWKYFFITLPALYFSFILGLAWDLSAALVHGLALYLMGKLACRFLKCSPGFGGTFFLGLFVYIPILGALSALSLVTLHILLIVDVLFICAAAIFLLIKGKKIQAADIFNVDCHVADILLVLFFVIVFRSSANLSHDPDWYSYAWMGNLSKPSLWAFDGYINAVHFYGKIQEATMGWLGFRVSPHAEIIFSSLFLIAALEFVYKHLNIQKKSLESALVLLLAAAPAVIGVATTGKADTLGISALLIAMTILICGKVKAFYPVLLVCILVFLTSKPTYFIWGGLMCLLYLNVIVNYRLIKSNIMPLALLIISVGVLWARTYINTGLLYSGISQLNSVQALLGIIPSNNLINVDFDTLVFDTSGFFEKSIRQFLTPGDDPNYSTSWIGLSGFVSLVLILTKWKSIKAFDVLRIFILIAFTVTLIGVLGRPNRILDGFYVLPVAFFLVIYFLSLRQLSEVINSRLSEVIDLSLIFMIFVLIYFSVFLSDWRRVFHRSDFFPPKVSQGFEQERLRYFKFNNMEGVLNHIVEPDGNCKTVAITVNRRSARVWNKIDCSVETFNSVTWQTPLKEGFIADKAITDQFYEFTQTRFTVIEKKSKLSEVFKVYANSKNNQLLRYEDDNWVLYETVFN